MNGDLVQSETTVGSRHCPGKAKFYGLLAALVIIASAEPLFEQVAKRLPSLRAPHAAAYHVRHVLMHSTPIATPGRRIFLVGSSVVRNNLDEKLLQQMLSRIEPVSVENLGMEAAYCLSVPILCAKLQALKPDLVIWGMSGGEFDQFQKDEECQMPWGSPMAVREQLSLHLHAVAAWSLEGPITGLTARPMGPVPVPALLPPTTHVTIQGTQVRSSGGLRAIFIPERDS